MNFNQLVKYIRNQGCRVRIWRSREYIEGSLGNFGVTEFGPIINVSIKNKKSIEYTAILLHEFGHFLQLKDGFLTKIENVCDAYDIYHLWMNKKKRADDN